MEIIKDNPIPKTKGRKPKYDFDLDLMEVGDSIVIRIPQTKIAKEVKIIRNRVDYYRAKNKHKKNFTVRQVDEGVGVWRTE